MKKLFGRYSKEGLPNGANEIKSTTTGFIVSSEGQHKYPGKKTMIPNANGRITMSKVGYPVLGFDDLGNSIMMQPGGEYQFPGNDVYEVPLTEEEALAYAQNGYIVEEMHEGGEPHKHSHKSPSQAWRDVKGTPSERTEKEIKLDKDLEESITVNNAYKDYVEGDITKKEYEDIKFSFTPHGQDRKDAYTKDVSEKIFRNITPQGYGDLAKNLDRYKRYQKDSGRDPEDLLWYSAEQSPTGKPIYYKIPKREDMFRLYLGLPQENNSFVPQTEYKPTNAKDPDAFYWKPNYWTKEGKEQLVESYLTGRLYRKGPLGNLANERTSVFDPVLNTLGVPWENPKTAEWVADNPLGDFTVSQGKDDKGHYISIYDIIDFDPFKGSGKGSSVNKYGASLLNYLKGKGHDVNEDTEASSLIGAGKPYEIYDRIYYNPDDYKNKMRYQLPDGDYHEGGEFHTHPHAETHQERWDREWLQSRDQDNTRHVVNERPILNLDGSMYDDSDYKDWVRNTQSVGPNPNKSFLTHMYEGITGIPDLITETVEDAYDQFKKSSILPANIANAPRDTKRDIKKRMLHSITPFGYEVPFAMREFVQGEHAPMPYEDIYGNKTITWDNFHNAKMFKGDVEYGKYVKRVSDEAWLCYLYPERCGNKIFTDSRYKPTKSKNKKAQYRSFVNDDDVWDDVIDLNVISKLGVNESMLSKNSMAGGATLQNYTLSKGYDEKKGLPYISYYDVYDFEVPFAENFGTPFNIYGRMYYDPDTKERVFPESKGSVAKTAKRSLSNLSKPKKQLGGDIEAWPPKWMRRLKNHDAYGNLYTDYGKWLDHTSGYGPKFGAEFTLPAKETVWKLSGDVGYNMQKDDPSLAASINAENYGVFFGGQNRVNALTKLSLFTQGADKGFRFKVGPNINILRPRSYPKDQLKRGKAAVSLWPYFGTGYQQEVNPEIGEGYDDSPWTYGSTYWTGGLQGKLDWKPRFKSGIKPVISLEAGASADLINKNQDLSGIRPMFDWYGKVGVKVPIGEIKRSIPNIDLSFDKIREKDPKPKPINKNKKVEVQESSRHPRWLQYGGEASLQKNALTNYNLEQQNRWKGLTENDEAGADIIREYNKRMGTTYNPTDAWSAILISNAIMAHIGATTAAEAMNLGFRPSKSHSTYIRDAFKTNLDPMYQYNRYTAEPIGKSGYKIGDILGKPRAEYSKWSYKDLEKADTSYKSHTDVIVDRGEDKKGEYIILAGGNISNTYKSKKVYTKNLDKEGYKVHLVDQEEGIMLPEKEEVELAETEVIETSPKRKRSFEDFMKYLEDDDASQKKIKQPYTPSVTGITPVADPFPIYTQAMKESLSRPLMTDVQQRMAAAEQYAKHGGFVLNLNEDEVQRYIDGGYVLEELQDGGSKYSKEYIQNLQKLLDTEGAHPLDLVYGNPDLNIPRMGTLENLRKIPDIKDYFFDPYGELEDQYVELRGKPQERKAASKRIAEGRASDAGFDNVEEYEAHEIARDERYQDEKKKWETQRTQSYLEDGFDSQGNRLPDWKVAGYKTPDAYYADMQNSGIGDIMRTTGLTTAAELTGIPATYRTYTRLKNDPLKLGKDVLTTAGDAIALPFKAGYELGDYAIGDGSFDLDTNPIFGNEMGEGLWPTLDVVGSIGPLSLMSKGARTVSPAIKPLTKQVINKVDDIYRTPTGAQQFNMGFIDDFKGGFQDIKNVFKGTKDKITSKPTSIPSAQKINPTVQKRPLKVSTEEIGVRLGDLYRSGKYWDEVGIPGDRLVYDPKMINYHGTYSGRPIVEVTMPDGSNQFFYKSTGFAGKAGSGPGGTTSGQWQVYGGHANNPRLAGDNWFIKNTDYKNYYGSNTYKDIANALDNQLIKKFEAKNLDELDQMLNFQGRNRGFSDDFIPGYKKGGFVLDLDDSEALAYAKKGYIVEELPEAQDGRTVSEIWKDVTGTPWSEAKTQGLTDGSYSQNIALRKRLLEGEFGSEEITPKLKSEFDYNAYDANVKNLVNSGYSLDDLVRIRMGTRSGLLNRFPNLFSTKPEVPVQEETTTPPLESKHITHAFHQDPLRQKVEVARLNAEEEVAQKAEELQKITRGLQNADWSSLGNSLSDYASAISEPFLVSATKMSENLINAMKDKSIAEETLQPEVIPEEEVVAESPQLAKPAYSALSQSAHGLKDFLKNRSQVLELDETDAEDLRNQGYVVEEVSDTPSFSSENLYTNPFEERWRREMMSDASSTAVHNIPKFYNLDGTDPDSNYKEWLSAEKTVRRTPSNWYDPFIKAGKAIGEEAKDFISKLDDVDFDMLGTGSDDFLDEDIRKTKDLVEAVYEGDKERFLENKYGQEIGFKILDQYDNPDKYTIPYSELLKVVGGPGSFDENINFLRRKLDKEGVINTPEAIIESVKEKVVEIKPKPETFTEDAVDENGKLISAIDIGYSNNPLYTYRNQWDNNVGFIYKTTPTKQHRRSSDKYTDVKGVAHFLLDASVDPKHPYSHKNNIGYIKKAMANDEWIPAFTKYSDDMIRLKYKKPEDILETDIVSAPLRQLKFSDINFKRTKTPRGFKPSVHEVTTKDGDGTYLLFKNRKAMSRFSGGSVVFIFKDKYDNTIVRDFAGSINAIESEGNSITKQYELKPGELTVGYHDVGSFSAKPKANKNNVLSASQWSDYNDNGWTGGALLIPTEQPTGINRLYKKKVP